MNSTVFRAALALAALIMVPALAAAQDTPVNCTGWERIAVHTEQVTSGHLRLREKVEITCDTFKFFADEVDLYQDEDRLEARGNVLFTTPDTRITASRLDFNIETKTGTFYDAYGTSSVKPEVGTRSMFGTQEADMYFHGEKLEKLGEKKYRLTNGGFTSCLQPTARWEFTSGSVTINIDKYVLATNTVFRVKGVPLLYLPVIYYPLEEDNRSTGFLMPGYGMSSLHGQTIRNAFFWAINRSMDATIEHNWFSKTGQAVNGEFRYVASEASSGEIKGSLVNETESTSPELGERPASRTTLVTARVNQQLPGRFRLGATADYASNITTRSLYDQDIYRASNPSSTINANISGAISGWQMGAQYSRNEVFRFNSSGANSSTLSGSSPRFNLSHAEQPLGNTPIYWGVTSEAVGILDERRNGDTVVENNRMRADIMPTIRAPLSKLPWLQLTASLAWRATWWSERLDPDTNEQIEQSINRNYFEMQANLVGPVFGRVFNTPGMGYAQRWKHIIEPSLNVSRTTGIDETIREAIPGSDAVDNIVGSVTRVTYALTNRVYAKRGEGPTAVAQEFASLVIRQSYYTDPTAVERDANYRNTITGEPLSNRLSPLVFALSVSPAQQIRFKVDADFDTQFSAVRRISAGANVSAGRRFDLDASWSQQRFVEGLPGFGENSQSNYLNLRTGLRTDGNKYGGSYTAAYDIRRTGFTNQALQAYYNAQCCGIGVEFQSRTVPGFQGVRGKVLDRRFNLSFTLAGIGTFSDFFGAFGGDPYRRNR